MLNFLKKIAAAVGVTDLRGSTTCDLQFIDEWEDNGEVMSTYEIYPYVNGKQAGYMDFIVHNFQDNVEDNYIEIIGIEIEEEYRGFGISTLVYKKFSELYVEKYDGYPLERLFQNPVAEYSFRKAVSNGFVDSTLLDNSRIQRDYKTEDKQNQWNDLNEKLPENVKGAKVRVGKYMSNIKLANTITDLRNLAFTVIDKKDSHGEPYKDIEAYVNGEQAGFLSFDIDEYEETLSIAYFEVEEKYQKLGIGTAIYGEFGKLYETQYSGWPVKRYFVNPVAEYAFRKAVSLGWVSENAISEDQISRLHSEEHDVLWKDLRKKLPENVQGPETWAAKKDFRKITASTIVDLRNLTIDSELIDTEEDDDEEYYYYGGTYQITASINGEEAGYLKFVETRTRIEGEDESFIYLAKIEVENKYREHGIGTLLYKEFGALYSQRYSGWEVERHFENPIAEYSFKKAIELGYVPSEAYTENKTTRDYSPEQQKLWKEVLEPKLQKAGGIMESIMKKVAVVLDLRKKSLPDSETYTNLTNKPLPFNVTDLRRKTLHPNVIDLRNINKLEFGTLDDYYTETGFKPQANLKDLRRTIGASAINEFRKLKEQK